MAGQASRGTHVAHNFAPYMALSASMCSDGATPLLRWTREAKKLDGLHGIGENLGNDVCRDPGPR